MTAKTKTLFAALAAATAAAAIAAPAAAQPYGYDRGDHGRYEQGGYDNGRYDNDRRDGGRWDNGRYDDHRGGQGWMSERARIADRRIDQGLRFGQLTPREHAQLSFELNQLVRLETRARQDGLDGRDRFVIEQRYDRLNANLRAALYDRDRRDYGAGYGYRR